MSTTAGENMSRLLIVVLFRLSSLPVGITAIAAAAIAAGQQQAGSPRVDLYGDPLPEGAVARLGSVRFSSSIESPLRACAYTPDGKQIVSISADGKLRFWDRKSGRETRSLEEPPSLGMKAPAGDRPRLPTHDRALTRDIDIALSPDGNFAAIAWWEESCIEIRDLKTGNSVANFATRKRLPGRPTRSIAFSCDGRRLLAVERGEAEILDLEGEPVGPPLPPRSRVAWAQARDVMLVNDHERLELRDRANGGLLRELDAVGGPEPMSGIALNADATKFAAVFGRTGPPDSRQPPVLKVFSLPEQSVLGQFELPFKAVTDLRFFAGDREVALAAHGEVYVWNLGAKTAAGPLDISGSLSRFQFSADGAELALARGGTRIARWRAPRWDEVESTHEKVIRSIVLSADGRVAVTSARDGAIRIWDTETGRQLRKVAQMSAHCVAISPDGTAIAFTALGVPTIYTVDPWSRVGTPSEEPIGSLGFSPDSTMLALGGKHTVTIVHAATGEVRARLPIPNGMDIDDAQAADPDAADRAAIHAVRFSPGGKFVAACARGIGTRGVVIWDLAGDEVTGTWAKLRVSAESLDFSSDAASLVVSDADDDHPRAVSVIDTASGAVKFIGTRGRRSHAVSLVDGGRVLVSAETDSLKSFQGSVAFYDVVSGRSVGAITGPSLLPIAAVVSADERRIAVSCNDGTALILDLQKIIKDLGVSGGGQNN